jgi:DNA-dependent RNA polymerase auxiliary subunit epsilon
MKTENPRPKHIKKEKSNSLVDLLRRITDDFDADKHDNEYAILQKELEEKALELLNEKNYNNERIAKLMAYFLVKYEKQLMNAVELIHTANKAKETFEEIVKIEESIPTGGRPQNDYIYETAKVTFEEFEKSNNGKQPSSIQLSELVGTKLKHKLEILKTQGELNLSKSEKKLLILLKQREVLEKDSGNRFYSESTALDQIKRILKFRMMRVDSQ